MADTATFDPNAARPAAGGDAVDAAYRRYWTELTLYIRKTFGAGPPEPEEVAQGAFARFASLAQPRAVENPRAFLYRCAHNIVMDHRRREAVRARLSADVVVLGAGEGAASDDAERVLSGKERLAIVDATVRGMEAKRRKVLIMHAIHGLNYSEIARRLGLSPTRVTQLVAEAVAQCNAALEAADDADGGGHDRG